MHRIIHIFISCMLVLVLASGCAQPQMLVADIGTIGGSGVSSSDAETSGAVEYPAADASIPELDESSKPDEVSQSGQSEQSDGSSGSSRDEALQQSSGAQQSSSEEQQSENSQSSEKEHSSQSSQSTQSSQLSQSSQASQSSQQSQPVLSQRVPSNEMRAVWFSYLDLSPMLKEKTQKQFENAIGNAFDNVVNLGMNTVIVQVRPFGDALYSSSYFTWSVYASGTQGVSPGFDPLSVMISAARARGLRIEAWVNPYRVRTADNNYSKLSDDNPAKKLINSGSDAVVITRSGIYYNPARSEAQQLIIDGVREIVKNYDVDGIHFDDYFYPNPDNSFDEKAYSEYKASGGKLSLGDWRRENVDVLVKNVYAAIKSIDSSVTFGISPQGNMSANYNTQYINVEKWVTNSGYVDYIMPQIYFGFNNSSCPYTETVAKWNRIITNKNIKLYVGLAPYKIGASDTYAGNGKNEWINNSDILSRQVSAARGYSQYGGFAMFRYASMISPSQQTAAQVKRELDNLDKIL